MTDELKPVRCGCGGEARLDKQETLDGDGMPLPCWVVYCTNCLTVTDTHFSEAEAITAWNRAMGERTAKVIEHDASVIMDGYKYKRTEYLCGECKKKVLGGDEYCSHCGCRLDWRKDE